MRRRLHILLIVLAGLVPFAVLWWVILHPDPARLRWQFRKGDVWRYEVTTRTSAIISSCVYSMTVLEVDPEGTATLQCKCEAASTKSGDWNYDSRRDPEPTHAVEMAFFNRLNQTMTLRMNPMGAVGEIEGRPPRSLEKTVLDTFLYPHYFSPDESLVWHVALPEAPVGTGDSWNLDLRDRGFPMPYEDRFTRTFRLEELSRSEARISMQDRFAPGREELWGKGKTRILRDIHAVFSVERGKLVAYTREQKIIGGNPEKTMSESLEVRLLDP